MLISIITPVYNGEDFIDNCVRNVIDQNCVDLEHVIIDGGSSDDTVNILKKYSHEFSHIQWVSEKDRGQSDAMNKGISMAKGEIIGFLNVDDYYEPGVLNRIKFIFEKIPEPSLVVGNCNVWGPDGQLMYINTPSRLTLFDLTSGRQYPVNPSSYFYHKSLHDLTGPYNIYDEYSMDIDFLLRAVQHAHTFYFDEIWGNFRFFEGTKTYNDTYDGQSVQRINCLFDKYRKNLGYGKRIHSRINFLIHEANIHLKRFLSNDLNRSL